MRFVSKHRLALGLWVLVCPTMQAQVTNVGSAGRPSATRDELESLTARADEVASSAAVSAKVRAEKQREAAALRARLREGDFEVGDRVVLTVRGDSALSDTFTVQP